MTTDTDHITITPHPDFYNAALDWAGVTDEFRLVAHPDGDLCFRVDTEVDGEKLVSALIDGLTAKWIEAGMPR